MNRPGTAALDHPALLGHLRTAVDDFADVLATGDLTAAVPACPDWDLRALTWHLGDIHRWARAAIVQGHGDHQTPPGPGGRAELRAWFARGAADVVETLAVTDPAAPAWAFGPRPRTAGFWFRRLALETAVHVHDALASQGGRAAIDPALAADGVDEVVRMLFPRQVRLGRTPALTRSLALVCTDRDHTGWVLSGDGTRQPEPVGAEASVQGQAAILLLLLWRRTDLDDPGLQVGGDPDAVRAVLGGRLTP